MDRATYDGEVTRPVEPLRFDVVERVVHWVNATLFFVLIVTAIPLYFGSLFGDVLPRFTIEQIHLWVGIALPFPIIASLAGPWGRRIRRDLRRISYWTHGEIAWLGSLGRSGKAGDKFNPGQKLNAIVVGASIPVLLVSGVILKWFDYFPPSWRAGSTFVHDVFAWLIVFIVFGHVALAFSHRDALRSMVRGSVRNRSVVAHAPVRLREDRVNGVGGADQPE